VNAPAPEVLRLLCVDLESEPLFTKILADRPREGYEVDVAESIAQRIGATVEWIVRPWSRMIPSLLAGEADAILCGQGITPEREELVTFTRPYAVFDEAILVMPGSGITGPDDLAGRTVLAIAGSTNYRLATSFEGANVVPFDAEGDDVLGDLVAELRSGRVDAVVDDEVVLHPLCRSGELEVAFSVATGNRWALAVAPDRPSTHERLDALLGEAVAAGDLERSWTRWMPEIAYPAAGLAR
jgi:ABC-type amino acid transport substrate-binding protein